MHYQRISLREANQNFSRVIAAVERGEAFCITRRGHEIARLHPAPAAAVPAPPAASPGASRSPHPAPLAPVTKPKGEAGLAERLLQVETRLDKLLSVLSATDATDKR